MYCNDTTTWNLLKRHLGHTLACVGYGNTRTGLVNIAIEDRKYSPSYEIYSTVELATKRMENLLREIYAKKDYGYTEEDIQKAVFDGGWNDGDNFLAIQRQEVFTK